MTRAEHNRPTSSPPLPGALRMLTGEETMPPECESGGSPPRPIGVWKDTKDTRRVGNLGLDSHGWCHIVPVGQPVAYWQVHRQEDAAYIRTWNGLCWWYLTPTAHGHYPFGGYMWSDAEPVVFADCHWVGSRRRNPPATWSKSTPNQLYDHSGNGFTPHYLS